MKLILICYHKNLFEIYPLEWVEKFKYSVLCQNYQEFEIYEINYGGGKERIFQQSDYESKIMPTFIHAMNYLIEKALINGADVVGNLNADDWYDCDWLRTQLPFIKYQGCDIVTCNFTLIQNDVPVHIHLFDKLDIKKELERGNNVVAHPAVLYSRRFLENNKYVPEEIPEEDFLLWKRTIDEYKFKIVHENLLYHRIHSNAVCQSNNR